MNDYLKQLNSIKIVSLLFLCILYSIANKSALIYRAYILFPMLLNIGIQLSLGFLDTAIENERKSIPRLVLNSITKINVLNIFVYIPNILSIMAYIIISIFYTVDAVARMDLSTVDILTMVVVLFVSTIEIPCVYFSIKRYIYCTTQ